MLKTEGSGIDSTWNMETDNLLAWNNASNITLNEEMSISLGILKTSLRNEIESREREIYSSILQLTGILDNIKEMYTEDRANNKKKRSLLPWGGDLLKSLFGTATESDLDGLRKQLRRISGNQNELVHVVENSLTMINKTNTFSKQNRQALNILASDLTRLDNKLIQLKTSRLNEVKLDRLTTLLTTQVTSILESVVTALQNTEVSINKLSAALEDGLRGQLSTTLVEASELRDILTDISKQIPESFELKSFEGQKITWFYKNLPVVIIPDRATVHIVTVIPLIPRDSLFTLYRVVVLPLPVPDSEQSSEVIIEGTHFAVSNMGNSFVILDKDELAKCTKNELAYCPLHKASMNLARSPCCLGSLFLGNEPEVKRNCPIKVTDIRKFPMFVHLTKGKWMVATRDEVSVHPRCNGREDFIPPFIVTPPVRIITLKSGCIGYSDYATLPPYFYKNSSRVLETDLNRLNIGVDMDHIYNLNDSSYTFDFQLINTSPVKMHTLSENMNIDISQAKSVLEKIKGNKITVWNENSFSKLVGSIRWC